MKQVFNPVCTVQAPGTYNPISGYCEAEPITPISLEMTQGLKNEHVCNKLPFNSIMSACVENSCGYYGICKKFPSKSSVWKLNERFRIIKLFLTVFYC